MMYFYLKSEIIIFIKNANNAQLIHGTKTPFANTSCVQTNVAKP